MSFPPPGSEPDRPLLPPSLTASSLPRPVTGMTAPSSPAWPAGGGAAPPPGYVAYNANMTSTALRSTAGLRQTAIGLFWVAVASSLALTGALYSRVSVWDEFVDGSAGLAELDDADSLVFIALLARGLVVIVAGIVLAIWSYRTVKNAQQFGGSGLQPGLAAGGWFIPIGNMWVPFVRLRRATESVSGDASRVSHWQAAWVTFFILSTYANNAFTLSTFADRGEIRSTLSNETGFYLVLSFLLAGAAFLGQRALNQVDRAIATRHEKQQRDTFGHTI